MSRFFYNLKQSFIQMGRNKGMYFTTIMAITAMMLILGLFFVSLVNVNLLARSIEKDYNVLQIYIKDGTSQQDVEAVGKELEAMQGVEKAEFVSKADALLTLREKWGENAYLLDSLPENPLPDSYNIYVSDKDAASRVAADAEAMEQIEDVVYYQETLEKLAKASRFIEIGSLIAMAFLVVVSTVIVANTIKLTVFNREKEIGIMKYLGATDSFVRAPFIWGGIIVGLLSACLATGLTYIIYDKVMEIIESDITRIFSMNIVPSEQLVQILLCMFTGIGVVIGAAGSMISIRRFLNK
ncbi:MAG: permease-like cell division protein FtsX [Mogibacterium sp.]|nr:permease-like cell division protein FtsX [Mogibacterium sp.]